MPRNEDGEFELVLGNSQLLIVFFLVIILLSVFFTMGYIVGRNSNGPEVGKLGAPVDAATPARTDGQSAMPAPVAAPPAHTAVDPVAAQPEKQKPIEIPAVQAPAAKAPIEVTAVTPSPSSGVVTPVPGQFYIQVTSVAKPQAEVLAEVLVKRGFKAIVAAGPDDKKFRVLVGPAKDAADAGKLKGDLEQAGFKQAFPKKF